MASSTITGTTSNSNLASKIEWSSSPSTANNSSTVTAKLYYRRTNTYSGTPTSGTGTFSITIDGKKVSTSGKLTIPNDKSWVLALTATKTVTHNTDGKKSITISATGYLSGTTLTSTTCSGTAKLDNIPRQATLTSAPDFNDESNPIIKYSNPAGANVSSLQACISLDGSAADVAYRDVPKTGTSYTFSLTDSERNVLRNATTTGNSRTVKFYLKTVIGGETFYSSLTKTLSIVNANPTFDASKVTYADTNTSVTSITGNAQHIVQNKSSLTVYLESATGKKGATISKYDVTVNGVTKSITAKGSIAFGAVNTSQNTNITVVVKDSRGNTTTVTKSITILAYATPAFAVTLERLNNYEDETYLTVDASISSVNGKNALTITYKKKQSGGSYGSATTLTNKAKHTTTCNKDYAYIFSITVSDKFESVSKDFTLPKGKFPLFIDTEKNAVGVNEFPGDGEALRVAGGVACFDDGIVLKSASKAFKITINDSGTLVITELS